jgi:DNA-binding response OmpR family regulator
MGAAPLVIVVDDFADVRDLYAECLANAGFRVEAAADAYAALDAASRADPDAVVMDLQMPGMDGWEAIRQLRSRFGARPFVLAVSAHSSEHSRQEAFDAGCDDFVAKPLLPNVLVTIVRAALSARAATAAS